MESESKPPAAAAPAAAPVAPAEQWQAVPPQPEAPEEAAAAPAAAAAAAPAEAPSEEQHGFDPIEAIKLGSLRLANMIKREGGKQPHAPQQHAPAAEADAGEGPVARFKATAAELGAKAKQQGGRFYSVSVKAAANTAEAVKRLASGEPVQALCRSELGQRPCPQLVLGCCSALVAGGGLTSERIFKHNPPPELVDQLAAAVAGPVVSVVPPGASPHAVAALLKNFLLGLPEPLLTYRLLPQWVAAGDNPAICQVLLEQLPPANANTLRLLMQTCHHVNEQSALNEMDAQALAEVLVPCLAWNPAPKAQGPPPAWQGLTKALSVNKQGAAAAGEQQQQQEQDALAAAPAAGGDEGGLEAAEIRHQAAHGDAQALDDGQRSALVIVVEFMITSFSAIFN